MPKTWSKSIERIAVQERLIRTTGGLRTSRWRRGSKPAMEFRTLRDLRLYGWYIKNNDSSDDCAMSSDHRALLSGPIGVGRRRSEMCWRGPARTSAPLPDYRGASTLFFSKKKRRGFSPTTSLSAKSLDSAACSRAGVPHDPQLSSAGPQSTRPDRFLPTGMMLDNWNKREVDFIATNPPAASAGQRPLSATSHAARPPAPPRQKSDAEARVRFRPASTAPLLHQTSSRLQESTFR